VTECSDGAVFVRLKALYNALVLYLALTSLSLSVLFCSSVVPSVTG